MHRSAVISILAASTGITASPCSPLEVVVARGTAEPGTFGFIVGDPFVKAVKDAVKGATAFKIDYPASAASDSAAKGAEMVKDYLTAQTQACPQQRFVATGYSQGASVMRRAMPKISEEVLQKVVALVTFGDPGIKDGGTQGNNCTVRINPACPTYAGTTPAGGTCEMAPKPARATPAAGGKSGGGGGPGGKTGMGNYDPLPPLIESRLCTNCANDPTCGGSGNIGQHLTYGQTHMSHGAKFVQIQFEKLGGGKQEIPR